jgi:uncharacterized membrane protein YkvI
MKNYRLSYILICLIVVYFLIKCLDGVNAILIDSTLILILFSLLIFKIFKFRTLGDAWAWGGQHSYFGAFLIFSYIAMAIQLGLQSFEGSLRIVDFVTLEIQAILFFTACIATGFWVKERIFLIFRKNR